jgi:hypothetical protein
VLAALAGAALIWWVGLFAADTMPATFVAGQGLTPFKSAAEYLLVALYGAAAVIFFVRSRQAHSNDLQWLAAAA